MELEKGGRCEQENPQDMAKIMKRHEKTLWKSSEVEMEQQEEEEEKEVVRIKEKKKKKKKNRCQGNEKSKHDQKSNNPAMKSARMELEQQQQEEEHEEEMDKIESKKRKKKNRKTNSNQTEHHQEMDKSHSKKSKKRKSAPQDKLHTMAGPNAVPEEGKGNPGKKLKGEKGVLQLQEDTFSSLGNVAVQIVANASDAAHQSHEVHDRGFELPSRRDGHRKARELIEAASSCAPNNRSESATGSHSVSIAVAGSILENAQSLELATVLAGQIARAAAIFRIDEVVVFDNGHETPKTQMKPRWQGQEAGESAGRLLMRILQYLEIPQYLRRALVPKHTSLCCVGVLPPLDAPHHVRRYEWPPYREGVILDKAVPNGRGSYVDVGLYKEVLIEQSMKAGTRVTVAMGSGRNQIEKGGNALKAVERTEPKVLAGLYWGYTVRYAGCLSAVFTECPFKDGYDYCVGTSEHGEKVRSSDLLIPKFKHMLIAFGGLAGLEESVELDSCLKVTGVSSLFDRYLNTCPNQGSRTIRTEEAILISLQFFQDPLQQAIDRSHG